MKIQNNTGFSLIEVLVTMLIMSVGLLSIAALQMNAKKATYDSVQRTFASDMVQEMADRMRANSGNLDSYLDIAAESEALAASDLAEWRTMLNGGAEVGNTGGLTSPTACVRSDVLSSAAGVYTISIAWRGVVPLDNSTLAGDACGNNTTLYGTSNEYRRIISIDFYISPAAFGV